ncbi:DNA-binding protein [Halomarina rubra]|uniref:DNA-binding protein n=1 Tax=Halomarina rubra TaxID=2071873 RepID=A0ABD6AZ41_9EURY|nr:DNA-binding protein [Halomarina rubra]
MSSKISSHKEGSEAYEHVVDPTVKWEVDERVELRATVAMEMQATIDSDVIEAMAAVENGECERPFGMTLEAEERWEARELEVERTRTREDRSQTSKREAVCRGMSVRQCGQETVERINPMDDLDTETRRAVETQAARIASRVRGGMAPSGIEVRIAERMNAGADVQTAVLETLDEVKATPGAVVPIDEIGTVGRSEVDIEGRISKLWTPSHPSIAQVGLLEDATGTVKFTSWARSNQPWLAEGDVVRLRNVAWNYYGERVSVALTGWSTVVSLGSSQTPR